MPWASGMALGYGIGDGLNSIARENLFFKYYRGENLPHPIDFARVKRSHDLHTPNGHDVFLNDRLLRAIRPCVLSI